MGLLTTLLAILEPGLQVPLAEDRGVRLGLDGHSFELLPGPERF